MLDKISKYKIQILFGFIISFIIAIVILFSFLSTDFYIGKWQIELSEETKNAGIESIEMVINKSTIDKFINLKDNVKIHERISFSVTFKDRLRVYGTIDKYELISIQSPRCRNNKCPKEIEDFKDKYKKMFEETTKQIIKKNIEISFLETNKAILNINSQDIFRIYK